MSGDVELLGNEPASLRAVRDPSRLREVVCSIGMKTPLNTTLSRYYKLHAPNLFDHPFEFHHRQCRGHSRSR